jgi:hypothetical protein
MWDALENADLVGAPPLGTGQCLLRELRGPPHLQRERSSEPNFLIVSNHGHSSCGFATISSLNCAVGNSIDE